MLLNMTKSDSTTHVFLNHASTGILPTKEKSSILKITTCRLCTIQENSTSKVSKNDANNQVLL
jgi:hypothetical protein